MSKILLLEDDLSLITGLTFALEKADYELDVAKTVKEAENICVSKEYDLLDTRCNTSRWFRF